MYPQKKIVEVVLKTVPDKNIILKSPDNQNEYHFEVQEIWLDVNYIHLEVSAYKLSLKCL